MSNQITIRYSDGQERSMAVMEGQTLLDAAEANGVAIVNECQSGICGTCVADCVGGQYTLGRTEGLSEQEREMGKILTCQTEISSDCVIELQYPSTANAAHMVVGEAIIEAIDQVSDSTAILRLDISNFEEELEYKPGQFAQIQVPGSTQWRNFSYAHAKAQDNRLEFIIRLLPQGLMSDYLRDSAKPGDRLMLRGSKGNFYLRTVTRPIVLLAGGTGIAAILPIIEELVRLETDVHFELCYGVNHYHDLCKVDELRNLSDKCGNFSFEVIVANPSPQWSGKVGLVTELLDADRLGADDFDMYLCGPPPMVEAARTWLTQHGLNRVGLYYEKFLPSGGSTKVQEGLRLDAATLDLEEVRSQGRNTAVVIGGSIAGIATAKMLTNRFERVIVLEKDSAHHPREGRPGASQGWHLHHLLLGGQREVEKVFPGIIDDMVEAGAFKVDMADQYRLYMAGSWKKVCKSGINIICAGRPLLEWCLRRRLDDEPKIDYRYDSQVQDLIYDTDANQVLGVALSIDGKLETIAAEFVVDASGKNTPVPGILEHLGVGAPDEIRDNINCFYSTMYHEVPPEKRWQDKVMVICYAYRPFELHYAAQYYLDSSRQYISTSLVGYNCYTPPRNAKEFYEFSKQMPNIAMTKTLEGLTPSSSVHNFRYPDMVRLKYEDMSRLPGGLVCIGDAYSSVDPVSGAGMTKALLEIRELAGLLDAQDIHSHKFVKRFYKKISKIEDLVWFVIREQNLRFSWLKDVEKKRPFYFAALTWYMDRVTELIHDDMSAYRKFLSVVHFESKPMSLMTPVFMSKVLGKWLWSKLRFRNTLIEENFGNGRLGNYHEEVP